MLSELIVIGVPGVGIVAFIIVIGRKTWHFIRRIGHFLDDWFGETARPGVPERPGVMVRLEQVELLGPKIADLDERVTAIETRPAAQPAEGTA